MMHSALLVKAIAGMTEQITIEDFSSLSGIRSRYVATNVAEFLLAKGIGHRNGTTLSFSRADRVRVAMLALQTGCDAEEVSSRLSWKDFEELASKVLTSLGYKTRTNVRLTKPRMEIDVVGVDGSFAVVLDCKHWKRSDLSAISRCCIKQVARVQELVKRESKLERVVPAVLTLHECREILVDSVPVIPVTRLGSFLSDIREYLPEICVVTKPRSA